MRCRFTDSSKPGTSLALPLGPASAPAAVPAAAPAAAPAALLPCALICLMKASAACRCLAASSSCGLSLLTTALRPCSSALRNPRRSAMASCSGLPCISRGADGVMQMV